MTACLPQAFHVHRIPVWALCAVMLGGSLALSPVFADEGTPPILPAEGTEQPSVAPDIVISSDTPLLELLGDLEMQDHPQMQPLVPLALPDMAFGPMQPDPEGYFVAPATAPVGARIPVQLPYDDRRSADNLVLIDPDLPDTAMTSPSGRNTHRIHDHELVHRRAADTPGIYELRLRRWANFDRRVMARRQIELFDIEIDMQVPEEVGAWDEFAIYLNPVMDGHLVIVPSDRDPENLVNENTRRDNLVEDAKGPGLFTRTAPRSSGDYEVRFHFNPSPRWSEQTGRAGRLMARAPLRVVDAGEEEQAEPDADKLAELEAQIEALSKNLDQVTFAQAEAIRDEIAALGLPALGLVVELLDRQQISPQLFFAVTAPQPPAQWGAVQASTQGLPAGSGSGSGSGSGATDLQQPQMQVGDANYQVTGVASDDVLNIRSGPGAETVILGLLPPDATGISVTGETAQAQDGGIWWQIADPTLPGGLGWVNARFLAPTEAGAALPATDNADVSPPIHAMPPMRVAGISANEVLYLRAAPSGDAPIVGMLPPDADDLVVTGMTQQSGGTDWVEVQHPQSPDGYGWADGAYLVAMQDQPATPGAGEVAQAFTQAPGLDPIDPMELENQIAQILHYAQDTVMGPGAALSPLTKSIVAVQSHDGRLPSVRYHLTHAYAEATVTAGGATGLISLIELRRFNLGPARHAQVVAEHGAENAAPLEVFGEGPHLVWRFALQGLRGVNAVILSAARGEIDMPEEDCLGFHCLMAQSIIPHMADWQMQPSVPAPEFRPSYDELWQGGPSSPAVLDMLALHNGLAEAEARRDDARWRAFEWREGAGDGTPFVDVIIETGLAQDAGAEVVLRDTDLMDDELQTIWYRLGAVAGEQGAEIWPGQASEKWPDRR